MWRTGSFLFRIGISGATVNERPPPHGTYLFPVPEAFHADKRNVQAGFPPAGVYAFAGGETGVRRNE
jgi:hypothetical protein